MPSEQGYPFYIHDQYIKDLSFENPNFLLKYAEPARTPRVSVSVETRAVHLGGDRFEILMNASAHSELDNAPVFVIEVIYACIVSVAPGVTQDVLDSILLVHCPFLMFPFVREIVANATRLGGHPPLMIEPIDFAGLYIDKKRREAEALTGDEGTTQDGSAVKNGAAGKTSGKTRKAAGTKTATGSSKKNNASAAKNAAAKKSKSRAAK